MKHTRGVLDIEGLEQVLPDALLPLPEDLLDASILHFQSFSGCNIILENQDICVAKIGTIYKCTTVALTDLPTFLSLFSWETSGSIGN